MSTYKDPAITVAETEARLAARLRDPADVDAAVWLEAGRLAEKRGHYAVAAKRLRRAAEAGGDPQAECDEALALSCMHDGAFAAAGYAWWRLARQTGSARGWAGLVICALVTERLSVLRRAERELSRTTTRGERRAVLGGMWLHATAALGARQVLRTTQAHTARSPLNALLRKASHTLTHEARQRPQRADVQFHLAQAEAALGETFSAHQSVNRALRINPRYASARALDTRLKRRAA